MHLWEQNGLYALAVFCTGVLGCMMPLVLTRNSSSMKARDQALSLGGMFSAGVFVAAGFIHMLGDASESLDAEERYPWAMLICSSGLLISMYIEYTATSMQNLGELQLERASSGQTVGSTESSQELPHAVPSNKFQSTPVIGAEEPCENVDRGSNNFETGTMGNFVNTKVNETPLAAVIAFLALSFHSIIAGLALGASDGGAGIVLIAILSHKGFAGFALSTSFFRSNEEGSSPMPLSQIGGWLLAFCMMTPVSILIGTAIQGSIHGSKAVDGLTAFAAGTFIYVGLIEILIKELTGEGTKVGSMGLKSFCLLLGYGLMAMLAIWV